MQSHGETMKSLNPYYTGIHLHTEYCHIAENSLEVLILIILEYIYIIPQIAELIAYQVVLILIILEYIYMRSWRLYAGPSIVLILIILEYIYI